MEVLEIRQLMAAYSIDGSGNNLANPQWGSTDEPLFRMTPPQYADGRSVPSGQNRASTRLASNIVGNQPSGQDIRNARRLSSYAYLWGQFIDHDISLTNTASPSQPFNIPVPAGDPWFDPNNTGTQVISFNRSEPVPGTGINGPRQQPNEITAFLDASMIYGSDAVRASALREGVGGRMLTSAGSLLPFNTMGLENVTLGGPASSYFVAGDVRANENVELTAMHTLWLREHNRLAAEVAQQNPGWTDEEIYQRARRLVQAEIQVITYTEFLPALLGPGAILPYNGYRPNVNPNIATEFSTGAFRFGHTMVNDTIRYISDNGQTLFPTIPLSQAFFNPAQVASTGIDGTLKAMASTNAQEVDAKVVDGLRNFLFGPPGSGGFDLTSLNTQRGRDHGINHYNAVRGGVGIAPIQNFSQLTNDPVVQQQLQQVYGNVNNMDLYIAGLASNHVPGSSLGPVFQRIVSDQFIRLRDGDRLWWQNDLSAADQALVAGTRLANVISRNSGISNLQPNVFFFRVEISGQVFQDNNGNGQINPGEPGIAGRTMSLINTDTGAVERTLLTDAQGRYTFLDIPFGSWTVTASRPNLWRSTTAAPGTFSLTRGNVITDVDFGQVRFVTAPPETPITGGTPVSRIGGFGLGRGTGSVFSSTDLSEVVDQAVL